MRRLVPFLTFIVGACSAPTATAPDPTVAGQVSPNTSGSTPQTRPVPSAATANLTGRWLSDTVTLPGVAGQECAGVTQVEFLITQSGATLSGWEVDRRCGTPGLPADTVARDSGSVSSPCTDGSCAAAYNMILADSAIWTAGGNWRLSLSANGDTLRNVTPDSVNHSFMPTLFVRQP